MEMVAASFQSLPNHSITLNCYLDDNSLRDAYTSMILCSTPTIHSPSSSISIFLKTTKTSNDSIASVGYPVQVSFLIQVSSILQNFKSLEKATWIQSLLQPWNAYEQGYELLCLSEHKWIQHLSRFILLQDYRAPIVDYLVIQCALEGWPYH